MRIEVNGEIREARDRISLRDLIEELALAPERLAVELNHEVVRRAVWPETFLSDGDRLEIVHFVGGGSRAQISKRSNSHGRRQTELSEPHHRMIS